MDSIVHRVTKSQTPLSDFHFLFTFSPVLLPGESHGQSNLVGYRLCGHIESDTAEHSCEMYNTVLWYIHTLGNYHPVTLMNSSTSSHS